MAQSFLDDSGRQMFPRFFDLKLRPEKTSFQLLRPVRFLSARCARRQVGNDDHPYRMVYYIQLNKDMRWITNPFLGWLSVFPGVPMVHKIGDKVIHYSYGFAEIIGIEEKEVAGQLSRFYVAKTKDMEIWIPLADLTSDNIRTPSSKDDIQACFSILRSKYEPLSSDRSTRKADIHSRSRLGTTKSLCELIRDLSYYKNKNKINEYEKSILSRAILVLVDEWGFAFQIPPSQARSDLNRLLVESYASSAQ